MSDETQPPLTPNPPTGWKPTTSTVSGVLMGGAASQIIVSAWNSFLPTHAIDAQTSMAVATLCTGLAGYFFPDGGRK